MVTEERTVEGAGAEVLELPLEMGALRRVPLWHPHARARNWLARIALDPREPGGLKRAFAPRANGEYYYLVGGLHVGDPIEFGADYYTGSGRRSPARWYGVIRELRDDAMIVEACPNGRAAVKRALEIAGTEPTPAVDTGLARVRDEELVAELRRRGYVVTKAEGANPASEREGDER